MLPYNFYYSKSGAHVYNNGSNQTNPTVPPEAISVSVRPHGSTGPNDWITTHNGHPDYIATAKNANTSDPDKQWITIDTNPSSPCRDTVYAMWTIFVFNPSYVFVATAHANPDGTHSDWSTPLVLPTRAGKPWDSYLLPHVAPDGTVYTTITNGPPQQGFSHADVDLVSSKDCGRTWQGPFTVDAGDQRPDVPEHDLPRGDRRHVRGRKDASGRRRRACRATPIRSTCRTRTARAGCLERLC